RSSKMTVVHHGNSVYTGVAADTKPTTGVATNARFFETDTRRNYSYNGSSWDLFNGITSFQMGLIDTSSSRSTYLLRYTSPATLLQTATEALVQTVYPYAFTIKRFLAKLSVNSVNG